MTKDGEIHGVFLHNTPSEQLKEIYTSIVAGLEAGFLKPIVGERFPLAGNSTSSSSMRTSSPFLLLTPLHLSLSYSFSVSSSFSFLLLLHLSFTFAFSSFPPAFPPTSFFRTQMPLRLMLQSSNTLEVALARSFFFPDLSTIFLLHSSTTSSSFSSPFLAQPNLKMKEGLCQTNPFLLWGFLIRSNLRDMKFGVLLVRSLVRLPQTGHPQWVGTPVSCRRNSNLESVSAC
jgi:hypothetical protein